MTNRNWATGFKWKNRGAKGLTLVELAIVLGVMGIVSGAIWATASAVRARQPIQDSVQLVSEIAMNVRGVYTGFPNAVAPNLQTQIDRNFFPLSIVNKTKDDTINAWGGTVRINFPGSAPLNGFSIVFTLPSSLKPIVRREACLGMITRLQGSAATNPAWSTSGTFPSGSVPPLDPSQGLGPSLVFINNGSWKNVTGVSADALFGATGSEDCDGFAYYYRM